VEASRWMARQRYFQHQSRDSPHKRLRLGTHGVVGTSEAIRGWQLELSAEIGCLQRHPCSWRRRRTPDPVSDYSTADRCALSAAPRSQIWHAPIIYSITCNIQHGLSRSSRHRPEGIIATIKRRSVQVFRDSLCNVVVLRIWNLHHHD